MAIPLIFLFRNAEVLWLSLRNACVLSLQLCLTLCDPTDCRGGSSVHGILQQEYWRRLPFPPPGDVSDPGIDTPSLLSPSLAGGFFPTSATWGAPSFQRCLPPSYSPCHKSCTKPLHPRPILLWHPPQFLPLSIHLAHYYRLVILK